MKSHAIWAMTPAPTPRFMDADGRAETPPHSPGAGGAGEGRQARRATLGTRRLGAGLGPPRSGRASGGAGRVTCARARADPLRADARVAVHVLSWGRLPDGRGPRRRAADRSAGAALRRCAPFQL